MIYISFLLGSDDDFFPANSLYKVFLYYDWACVQHYSILASLFCAFAQQIIGGLKQKVKSNYLTSAKFAAQCKFHSTIA